MREECLSPFPLFVLSIIDIITGTGGCFASALRRSCPGSVTGLCSLLLSVWNAELACFPSLALVVLL